MELGKNEELALKGEYGPGLELAYKILVSIGTAKDATKLIPIKWAHISGVNFNTIGHAGTRFLEAIDKSTKVSVTTTLNPMGYDLKLNNDLDEEFKTNQMSIINSYMSLGIKPSFTCIPYEVFDLPRNGEIVSFAESNAAVFVNSILGSKTNKESALSSLASALTGKTPYSDLLIDKFRKPRITIKPGINIETELDSGLLGYFAGKTINESSVGFEFDLQKLDIGQVKALSAGIGTSGICGMFSNYTDKDCEKISFGRNEIKEAKDDLVTTEKGDLIVFGSPQLGSNELYKLSCYVEGKKFKKRCMIFCPRQITESSHNREAIEKIKTAGAEILCDSCTCLTPLITKKDYDSIVTNSIKCGYYMKRANKIEVALNDMKTITKEYCN